METQPVNPVGPQHAPVVVKQKIRSRPAVVILSVLFVLALTGLAALTYAWAQENQKVSDTQQQLSAANKKFDDLNAMNVGSAKADEDTAKIPNFWSFNSQYNNFLENGVSSVDRAKEEAAIEAALRQYYKLSTLPEGWAVLSIYQVVKPGTPPTGDYYALVYWPKSEQKPAGFIPLYKQKGSEWKYQEGL